MIVMCWRGQPLQVLGRCDSSNGDQRERVRVKDVHGGPHFTKLSAMTTAQRRSGGEM